MTQSNLPAESSKPEHLRFQDRCSCGHLRGQHGPQFREYQDCEKCGCEHFVLQPPSPQSDAPTMRELGLRELEWDKTFGNAPCWNANAVIERHNQEILAAFKLGRLSAPPVVKAALPWELGEDGLPPLALTMEDAEVSRKRGYICSEGMLYTMFAARERQLREVIQHIQEGK